MDAKTQQRMAALEFALRTTGDGCGANINVLRMARKYEAYLRGEDKPSASEGPMQGGYCGQVDVMEGIASHVHAHAREPDPETTPVAEIYRDGRWWMLCHGSPEGAAAPMAHAYVREMDGEWRRAGLGVSNIPVPEWLLTVCRALGWRGVD